MVGRQPRQGRQLVGRGARQHVVEGSGFFADGDELQQQHGKRAGAAERRVQRDAGRYFVPHFQHGIPINSVACRAGDPGALQRLIESTGSTLDASGAALYRRLVSDPSHVAGALRMMARWDLQALQDALPRLAVPLRPGEWLAERRARLDTRLKEFGRAARTGTIPGGIIENGKLHIDKLRADTPEGAEDLVLDLYQQLPPARITDLLLEVDERTGFSEAFTHCLLYTSPSPRDRPRSRIPSSA